MEDDIGGGGDRRSERSSIDVTSLWLSVEVNLLGDGWAYAIVCELTGFARMDLLFHRLSQCPATVYRQNTEMIKGQFPLSEEFLMSTCFFLCQLQCALGWIDIFEQGLLFGSGEQLEWFYYTMGDITLQSIHSGHWWSGWEAAEYWINTECTLDA